MRLKGGLINLRHASVVALALIGTLSCTREIKERSSVSIRLPQSAQKTYMASVGALSSWSVADPATMGDVLCYAVAVGGESDFNNQTCSDSSGGVVLRAGVLAGLFAAGTDITVDVPSGPKRTIYLIGFGATSATECKLFATTGGPNRSVLSAPHIVAKQTLDLAPGDNNITMQASLTGATKFESCTSLGGTNGTTPTPPAPAPFAQVVTAQGGTCGILTDGKLKCWGFNYYGALGDGTTTDRYSPTLIDPGVSYQVIAPARNSGGPQHMCGITTAGVLKCWGSNTYGQLGDGTTVDKVIPTVVVDPGVTYTTVATGGDGSNGHSCGITDTGVLKCWGSNNFNQLGDGTTVQRLTPVVADSGTLYSKVSVGTRHTCGITIVGDLKCWGQGSTYGNLGTGSPVNLPTPTVINSGTTYSEISVYYAFTCGITTVGALKCWGTAPLGNGGASGLTSSPTVVDSGVSYSKIAPGPAGTCGITTGGVLKCWGFNSGGQVGDGTTTTRLAPVVVDSGVSYSTVSMGENQACGMTTAGVAKCWGSNSSGALGTGDTTNYFTPTNVVQ